MSAHKYVERSEYTTMCWVSNPIQSLTPTRMATSRTSGCIEAPMSPAISVFLGALGAIIG